MPLRAAIFEPEADGHHMALHVRNILREMIHRGWEIHLVTTERSLKHPAYKLVEEEFGGKYQVHLMPDTHTPADAGDLQRLKDQFKRLDAYKKGYQDLIAKTMIDVVYMVNIDQADLPMAFKGSPFGKTPFAGMLIGRHFHCPAMGVKMEAFGLRDKIFGPLIKRVLKIKTLKRLLTLDETQAEYIKREKWSGAEKVVQIPDVASLSQTPLSEPARTALGIPDGQFVILAYGALSLRKGVEELIQILDNPHSPENSAILFAGRQDDEAKAALQSPAAQKLRDLGRIHELVKFLDDEDESRVFQATDVVWIGYRHWYGMSGVLVQAARAGKPVLAMDQGLIGKLVEKYKVGLTAPMSDPDAMAMNLLRLSEDRALWNDLAAAGVTMGSNHTPELFGQRICDQIEATAASASS